ncbi:MAG: hypothetical protein ACK4OM_01820 [Alphaproteobacteria bacterium]
MKNPNKQIFESDIYSKINVQNVECWKDFIIASFKLDYQSGNTNIIKFWRYNSLKNFDIEKIAAFYAGKDKKLKNQVIDLINACAKGVEYNEEKLENFAKNLSKKIIEFAENKLSENNTDFLFAAHDLNILNAELKQREIINHLPAEKKLNRYYEFEERLNKTEINNKYYSDSQKYLSEAENLYSLSFLPIKSGNNSSAYSAFYNNKTFNYKLDLLSARLKFYHDDFSQAIERYRFSLDNIKLIERESRNKYEQHIIEINYDRLYVFQEIGLCYQKLKDYDPALNYYMQSAILYEQINSDSHVVFSPITYTIKLLVNFIEEVFDKKDFEYIYENILCLNDQFIEFESILPAELKIQFYNLLNKLLNKAIPELENIDATFFTQWKEYVVQMPKHIKNNAQPVQQSDSKINYIAYFISIFKSVGDKYNINFETNESNDINDDPDNVVKSKFLDFAYRLKENMVYPILPSESLFNYKELYKGAKKSSNWSSSVSKENKISVLFK